MYKLLVILVLGLLLIGCAGEQSAVVNPSDNPDVFLSSGSPEYSGPCEDDDSVMLYKGQYSWMRSAEDSTKYRVKYIDADSYILLVSESGGEDIIIKLDNVLPIAEPSE